MDSSILAGKKVLVTAGPTREAIDPVRFISNYSTGKMGYAIADKFLELGAEVVIVSGPTNIQLQHPHLKILKVESASEMYLACCKVFKEIDIAIFTAAVADYRPAKIARQKIKKNGDSFTIKMVKNIDIAREFGNVKADDQISVGFALETNDELFHAEGKLKNKNFDMVVLNSTNDANATFGCDTNKVTIIKRDLSRKEFPLKQKTEVARDILKEITSLILNENQYETLISLE